MTSQDFSFEFDLMYNNISSNQAPGLTEYEKSVFLTQAQEAVVLDLYKGTAGDSFETTEEVTRYLSSLVKIDHLEKTTPEALTPIPGFDVSNYKLPNDLWFIVYHSGYISVDGKVRDILIVPSRQDTLYKDLHNPFKQPNKNRTLIVSEEGYLTTYSKYELTNFYIKYLKRPNPIVLEGSEFSINDVQDFQIDLPESLHGQILLRAVQMAKAVWQS